MAEWKGKKEGPALKLGQDVPGANKVAPLGKIYKPGMACLY